MSKKQLTRFIEFLNKLSFLKQRKFTIEQTENLLILNISILLDSDVEQINIFHHTLESFYKNITYTIPLMSTEKLTINFNI